MPNVRHALLWLLFALAFSVTAQATDYYVDDTSPSNPGSGSYSDPYRNIQSCANVAVAGDTCYIRAGTYRETVTPAYSGSSGSPIKFEAYNGETVTIDGSDTITGWTLYSGSVYRASIGWDLGAENQVFVSGSMGQLARWPNVANASDPFDTGNFSAAQSGSGDGHVVDSYLPSNPPNFWQGAVIWASFGHKWSSFGTRITSSTGSNLYYTTPSSASGWSSYPGAGSYLGSNVERYFLSDKLELLDAANEWWVDHTNHYLYIQVAGGGNPGSAVTAKRRQLAFDLSSKSYIEVRGVHIFASTVSMEGADHSMLDQVEAKYLTHHSMDEISYELAWGPLWLRNGISISGNSNSVLNSVIHYSVGSCITINSGDGHVIDNNDVSYCNYANSYCVGIEAGGDGPNVWVTRNSVAYTGGPSGSFNSAGALIAFNEFSYSELLGDDRGSVNAGRVQVAYNWLHDIGRGLAYGITPALYTDSAGDDVTYHHNVIWNVQGIDPAVRINNTGSGNGNNGMFVYNNTAVTPSSAIVAGAPSGVRWTEVNNYVNQASSNYLDSSNGDFRLTSSASAINAGTVIGGITDGYVTSPDLGAYEYGGSACASGWSAGPVTAVGPSGQPAGPLACAVTEIPLVSNSGFEDGNTNPNWVSGNQGIMVGYGHAGSYSEWIGQDSGFGQSFYVSPYKVCTVSAWAINWSDQTGQAILYAYNNGAPAVGSSSVGGYNQWVPVSVSFTTDGTGSAGMFVWATGGASYGFDDFQVVCR